MVWGDRAAGHGRVRPNSIIADLFNPIGPPVKFFIDNWFLFLAAAVSGALLLWPMLNKSAGGAGKVSTNDAVQMINREKAVLIDVSEPAEYAAGHPSGARSVPLGSLESSNDLPKNKTLPLVVVCPTGTRAGKAVATLKKLGFENARALAGGLEAWRAANLPVEKKTA
jgi:rhodanese-related sulfurtransferase